MSEKVRVLKEKTEKRKHLLVKMKELEERKERVAGNVKRLEQLKNQEQLDVDKLEGRSLARFIGSISGNLDGRLEKEKQEAYAALLKYEAAVREHKAILEDMERINCMISELDNCESEYAEAVEKRITELKSKGDEIGMKIMELEEDIVISRGYIKEIDEAIEAGRKAQKAADKVLEELGSADTWGTIDIIAGGFISTLVKHSHLDAAQDKMENLQIALGRFKTELGDVQSVNPTFRINSDGLVKFADWFFDGLIVDVAVQSRIYKSKESVTNTRREIGVIIDGLNDEKEERMVRIEKMNKEIEELVVV